MELKMKKKKIQFLNPYNAVFLIIEERETF